MMLFLVNFYAKSRPLPPIVSSIRWVPNVKIAGVGEPFYKPLLLKL